ncbi:hypothetical protein JXA85_08760, partial [Candidatus Woesearchaeota archaeon]|nr:hypothetical protein [Candidatus Woesearchaeota archaeon]
MAQMYGQGWKKSYAPFRDRHSIPDHSGKRPYEGNDFKPGDIADMLGDLMNQGATYRHRAQYTDDFAYRVASKMWLKVKNRSQNKITLADLFNGKVPKYICRNMPRIAITQNLNQKEAFELIERLYKVLYSGSTNPASETPRFELKKKGRVPGKEYEKKKENVNATEPLSRGLESTIAEIYSAYSNISLHAQS